MHHLIYSSVEREPLTEGDRKALLAESRKNNATRGITGVLLHRDGRFIQALEGEEGQIRSLLQRIQTDGRHTDVKVIYDGPTPERRFPDWAMGYRDLSAGDQTQGHPEPILQRMFAGEPVETVPGEGSRLIRALFRSFAVGAEDAR